MTIRDALAQVERRLGAAGVDTPRVDAEWLVAHVLGVPRTRIHEHGNVDERELERLTRRREQREPLAYVLGEWGFRRLTLKHPLKSFVVCRMLVGVHVTYFENCSFRTCAKPMPTHLLL